MKEAALQAVNAQRAGIRRAPHSAADMQTLKATAQLLERERAIA